MNRRIEFNCNNLGLGDVVLWGWMAQAFKDCGNDVVFTRGSNDKKLLVEKMGFAWEQFGTGDTVFAYKDSAKIKEKLVEGCTFAGACAAWGIVPQKPQVRWQASSMEKIGADFEAAAGEKPVILLFPFGIWKSRIWPLAYWVDLAWQLQQAGAYVLAMGPTAEQEADLKRFPNYAFGVHIPHLIEMVAMADMVVCNESGPAHLTGLTCTLGLAMTGPTKNLLNYLDNVSEVYTQDVSCVGCGWKPGTLFTAACDVACRALMLLEPEAVCRIICQAFSSLDWDKVKINRLRASDGLQLVQCG